MCFFNPPISTTNVLFYDIYNSVIGQKNILPASHFSLILQKICVFCTVYTTYLLSLLSPPPPLTGAQVNVGNSSRKPFPRSLSSLLCPWSAPQRRHSSHQRCRSMSQLTMPNYRGLPLILGSVPDDPVLPVVLLVRRVSTC